MAKMNQQKVISVFIFLLLCIFSFISIKPLFADGFFPMHDDTQPSRVYEMTKAFADGMFPVRWSENLGYGYGYPLFTFYAPLAYYVGALFTGLGIIVATKIMMALGFIFAGVTMFFLGESLWGKWGGAVSALLYLFAPYHALNLYVRGDVSEFFAYGITPLVFLAIYKLHMKDLTIRGKVYWLLMGSISFAGIILSHNLSALMITPFLFVFAAVLFYKKSRKEVYTIVGLFFLGIVLSAFYWLPVFFEMRYTNVLSQIGGKADYRQHYVCPRQLWESEWGFGGSTPTCIDGMSYRVGKLHLFAFVAVLLLILITRKQKMVQRKILIFGIIASCLSLLLATKFSAIFWDTIPFMSFFQYPWRFLFPATFFLSLIAGRIHFDVIKKNILVIAFFLVGILFLYAKLFQPQIIYQKTDENYISTQNLRWHISKISDEYLPKDFEKPVTPQEVARERFVIPEAEVTILESRTQRETVAYKSKTEIQARIFIAPFPAWKFYVDETEVNAYPQKNGYTITLPQGSHRLQAVYTGTFVETLSNMISLAGVIGILIAIIKIRPSA